MCCSIQHFKQRKGSKEELERWKSEQKSLSACRSSWKTKMRCWSVLSRFRVTRTKGLPVSTCRTLFTATIPLRPDISLHGRTCRTSLSSNPPSTSTRSFSQSSNGFFSAHSTACESSEFDSWMLTLLWGFPIILIIPYHKTSIKTNVMRISMSLFCVAQSTPIALAPVEACTLLVSWKYLLRMTSGMNEAGKQSQHTEKSAPLMSKWFLRYLWPPYRLLWQHKCLAIQTVCPGTMFHYSMHRQTLTLTLILT